MSKSKTGRHHPPAGAAGTPRGPHKAVKKDELRCECGRCTNERLGR